MTRLSSQTRSLRTFTKKGRWLHFHRARVPFPTPDGASQRPPARGGGPRGVPQRGVDAVPRRARVVQKTHGRGVRGESASAPLFPSLAIPNDFSFPAHPEAGRVRAATAREVPQGDARGTVTPRRPRRRATLDDPRGTHICVFADVSRPHPSKRHHEKTNRRRL